MSGAGYVWWERTLTYNIISVIYRPHAAKAHTYHAINNNRQTTQRPCWAGSATCWGTG